MSVDFYTYVLYGLLLSSTVNTFQLSVSATSTEKLERTATWLKKMRSVVELFNRCLSVCDDLNEARLAMADVFGMSNPLFWWCNSLMLY